MTTQAKLGLRLVLVLAVLAGYIFIVRRHGPPEGAAWRPVAMDRLSEEEAEQVARAEAARDALFAELMSTLQAALAEDGPASSISVCRDEAPRIAARVSAEKDVAIGRTALRLRNPDNQPPAWASAYVASDAEQPAAFAAPDGRVGVLLPIRVQPPCLACHGTIDELAPGVREALARNYVEDRATGFTAGDLRGWFWIEVGPL